MHFGVLSFSRADRASGRGGGGGYSLAQDQVLIGFDLALTSKPTRLPLSQPHCGEEGGSLDFVVCALLIQTAGEGANPDKLKGQIDKSDLRGKLLISCPLAGQLFFFCFKGYYSHCRKISTPIVML